MKYSWVSGLLLAAISTMPASSQISLYIGITPPPIRIEAPPPPPGGPESVWVEGFWAPQGHHYHWVAGHYERPPFPGAHWAHPHYDHVSQGWEYHEGYWDHEDHEHGHGHAYGHYKDDHDHDHGHDDRH